MRGQGRGSSQQMASLEHHAGRATTRFDGTRIFSISIESPAFIHNNQ
jgi:hypothetical protein